MKPEVSRSLFQAMKKYFTLLDENDYKLTEGHTDFGVLQLFRKYCTKQPVDLATWTMVNPVGTGISSDPIDDRICFVRDRLNPLLHPSRLNLNEVMVIGSHVAKGVSLPIFHIGVVDYRLQMILANNFHSWNVSVQSDIPLPDDLVEGIFDKRENIGSYCFCKFPTGFDFKSFSADPRRFSFSVNSDYYLFTFCFLVKRFLLKQYAV